MKRQPDGLKEVLRYARDVIKGKIEAGEEIVLACKRFLDDYNKSKTYIIKPEEPEAAIRIIESTLCYREGRDPITGAAYNSRPFRLQPWQKFHVYNLLGIYARKSGAPKYRESFTMVPRKNGKTPFVAALAWAMALLRAKAGASVYVVAASLNQAMETFTFLAWNVRRLDPHLLTSRAVVCPHSALSAARLDGGQRSGRPTQEAGLNRYPQSGFRLEIVKKILDKSGPCAYNKVHNETSAFSSVGRATDS